MNRNQGDYLSAADTGNQSSVEGSDEILHRELATIMPVIAAVMIKQADAESCAFYIYDFNAEHTVLTFRHGDLRVDVSSFAEHESVAPGAIPVEEYVLRTGKSVRRVTAEDFEKWPIQNSALREASRDYTDIVVPLCHHNRVYGVVYLWRNASDGAFSDTELSTAESMAGTAAMAVEFARQYGDERSRRLRLNSLLNVASLAASHLTVDQVMPAVVRIVRSATDADVANLYVFDSSGNRVIDSYSSGLNAREQWVFSESHGYQVSVVPAEVRAGETLAPVVVRDPERELAPGSDLIQYSREEGISEILVVPIVYQRGAIGVIYLWYRDQARTFHPDAISTAQGIANQAGGVVYQARMHDASRQHIQETEALRRIGETVLNSSSLETVLDEIADVLQQLIPYEYAYVGEIDDEDEVIVDKRIWGDLPEDLLGFRLSLHASLTGATVLSGEILNLSNAMNDDRVYKYQPKQVPIRSVLIAPLVTENGTVGVLYIARNDDAGFTEREERLMALISQQAAVAIERTQTQESMALHAARQSFLANATIRLIATSHPADALQDIAEMACEVLADGVLFALSTWEYGSLHWSAIAHRDPENYGTLNDGLRQNKVIVNPDRVEQILASAQPSHMILDDGHPTDERVLHSSIIKLLREMGAREMLTVPMRQNGRAPGLLVLLSSDPSRHLQGDVLELAQAVANRIGDALERRQLADNREALLRVSEASNTHAGLDELLEMFIAELHRIIPYDQMFIGRLEQETGIIRALKYYNPLGIAEHEIERAANEGNCGEVVRSRKALIDNHAHLRGSTRYANEAAAAHYARHGQSVIAAPLIAENRVSGVLLVGRSGTNRFSESDFETFLLFAGLAASAIHRTDLLQTNRRMYRASVEVLAAVVDAKDP
ncbi:MAG: GAF domain-containing protein, partial [Thermomicrobiaceae bacterium]